MISELDRDLAELQQAAGAYAARHRRIADFGYPPGVRIAVNFTLDFDSMLLRRLLNEPPMQLAKGEFGGRVGIWRLIELFDAHKVKATIFTPGRACELYPQAIRAAVKSGHEIADHMWEHRVPKEASLEEDHLAKTVAAIEAISGRRPVGTRSGHSAPLLRKYGYIYRSEGSADQLPALRRRRSRRELPRPSAVPLRDRRRDVLQLCLARQRECGAAHHRPGTRVRHLVGGVSAAISRRRLPQHLHAPVRFRPGIARRDGRPADHPDEDPARVCGSRAARKWRAGVSKNSRRGRRPL